MPLSNWPSLTNDSGTGTDGTALDKTLFDSIRASIEAAAFSATNPTRTPANTTDEVITARGAFANLDARLDDLDTQIGGGSSAATSTLSGAENIAKNPDFAAWGDGGSSAPDNYALSGAAAAVVRTGSGEVDTVTLGAGPFSAKLTFGAGAARLTQSLIATADWSASSALGADGRKVSATIRARTSTVNLARLVIDDGVTTTASSYHSGDGTNKSLTVTHTISASATKLDVYMEAAVAGSAYFQGLVVVFADNPAPSWLPPPRYGRRILDVNVTAAGNVGAPETSLMQYQLAPNLLRAAGVAVHIVAFGDTAANGTGKTLKFKVGSSSTTLFTGSQNNRAWCVDIMLFRVDASTQYVFIQGASATTNFAYRSSLSLDETTQLLAEFTGDANANNDIVQRYMMVEVIEPGAGI